MVAVTGTIALIVVKWLNILTSRPEVQYMLFLIGLGLDSGFESISGFGIAGTIVSLFFNVLGFAVYIPSKFIFALALFGGILSLAMYLRPHN